MTQMRRADESCFIRRRLRLFARRAGADAVNPIYEQMKTSVFERMSGLAAKHGAVNLGQGFPDFGWPEPILDAAARALKEGSNQYPPSRGVMPLRDAIAAHYGRQFGQQ